MADHPTPELAQAEKNIFGADAKYHPITLMPLEQGIGALTIAQQAQIHCQIIESRDGKTAADAMRRKLAAAAKFDADATILAAEGVSTAAAKGA